jgi:hypothetical protein
MKSKISNGAWKIETNSFIKSVFSGAVSIFSREKSEELPKLVCVLPSVRGDSFTDNQSTIEATAVLITAAPYLLKKMIINYLLLLTEMPMSFRCTGTGQAILSNSLSAIVAAIFTKDADIFHPYTSQLTHDYFEGLAARVKANEISIEDAIDEACKLYI